MIFLFPRWDMVGYVCSLKGTMHDVLFTLPVGCFMMLTIFAPSTDLVGYLDEFVPAGMWTLLRIPRAAHMLFLSLCLWGGCSGQHGSVDGAATLGSAHELFSSTLYTVTCTVHLFTCRIYIYIFFCLIQSLYLPWYKSIIYIHLPQPLGSVIPCIEDFLIESRWWSTPRRARKGDRVGRDGWTSWI